ncbi:MAG: cation:proton antiporter [Spirochaetes bacterium]|nr:MAG: cation:proton antiporter [Spirochaetota bacterium]RKX99767.1 MAG: cation:proton antiporter [Spirochaetota bacterium]
MTAIVFFIFLFIVWLLLTLNITIPNIVAAAIASLIVTIFFTKNTVKVNKKIFQIKRYFWAFIYSFIFLWECIKANIDVAYRVLHPGLPVKPGIVEVESVLKTDIAKVFLANSITMTPGTITVDIIDNNFYVHWIYVKSMDPDVYTERIIGRFEKYIMRIFE